MSFKRTKVSIAAATLVGGLVGTTGALAQSEQRVEITGSSIKRVEAESALPVTIVTRADIEKSGVLTTEELLSQITSVSSAGCS